MKNIMRKLFIAVMVIGLFSLYSCSKDSDSGGSGTKIYYVIEGILDPTPNEPNRTGNAVNVNVSMTMPSGSPSVGLTTTPHTTAEREYTAGMTLTITAESVPSYTTITVKIYKDGVLWKSNTNTATGFGNYAVAQISGTL